MRKIWALCLALLLLFSMTACSAKPQSDAIDNQETPQADAPQTAYTDTRQTAKPNPDDTFAATYQITRIDTFSGEGSADEAAMQDIRDRGYRTLLVLQEDGTGVMDLRGELTPFVYDDDSGVITMNDQTSQMTLSEDGSLVIRDAAGTMYLELLN